MKQGYFMKTFILILFAFLIAGCIGKHLTVKSLHPSLIPDKKIHNIILEDFEYDNINQANYIEEKLVNKTVDGQRVFNLQATYENIDAIVTGKILESSMYYDFYYDEGIDYRRCGRYEYKNGKKTNKCLKHRIRRIPCEKRDYRVKTKIDVLDKNERVIFSKIYTKSKFIDKCYRHKHFYPHPYYYNRLDINRAKYSINSNLAQEIAQEAINDISPHYIYRKITIIDKLEDKKYSESINKEFEDTIKLLDNGTIHISQTRLYELNKKLDFSSYEVLYNLALTYEALNSLEKARNYYIEAKSVCKNIDDLPLIQNAINRMQRNLIDKIKAKSQLPIL
jgi:tetratricopeptide (TPR) repeat protein